MSDNFSFYNNAGAPQEASFEADLPKDLGEKSEDDQNFDSENRPFSPERKSFEETKKQAELVHERAVEYWEKFILSKERNYEETAFEFKGQNFDQRAKEFKYLEEVIARVKVDQSDGEKPLTPEEVETEILKLEREKVKLIIEQAYADFAFARKQVEKTKQEIEEMADGIGTTEDKEDLQQIKETVGENLKKQTKFEIYAKAAQQLFKDYYSTNQAEKDSTDEAKAFFLDLNNEFIEVTEIADAQHRTLQENDSNLEIIGRQINQLLGIDWRRVMDLIEEREDKMAAEEKRQVASGKTEETATEKQEKLKWADRVKEVINEGEEEGAANASNSQKAQKSDQQDNNFSPAA